MSAEQSIICNSCGYHNKKDIRILDCSSYPGIDWAVGVECIKCHDSTLVYEGSSEAIEKIISSSSQLSKSNVIVHNKKEN